MGFEADLGKAPSTELSSQETHISNFFFFYIGKNDKITQPVIFYTIAKTVSELPYIDQE